MGKSSVAEVLAKYYKLHHIKLKDVISEAIAKLVTILATLLGCKTGNIHITHVRQATLDITM